MKIEGKRWIVVYRNPNGVWVFSDSSIHGSEKFSIEAFARIKPRDFKISDEYEKAVAEIWGEWQKDNDARCIEVTIIGEIPDKEKS